MPIPASLLLPDLTDAEVELNFSSGSPNPLALPVRRDGGLNLGRALGLVGRGNQTLVIGSKRTRPDPLVLNLELLDVASAVEAWINNLYARAPQLQSITIYTPTTTLTRTLHAHMFIEGVSWVTHPYPRAEARLNLYPRTRHWTDISGNAYIGV